MKTNLTVLSLLAIATIAPLSAMADEKGDHVVPGKESTTTSVPQPITPKDGAPPAAPDKTPGKASTTTDIPTPHKTDDGKVVPEKPSK